MNFKSLGNKIIKLYALATLGLTAIAVLLRTICLRFFYDTLGQGVGYYTNDALPIIFYVVCFIAVVLSFTVNIFLKSGVRCSDGKEDNMMLNMASVVAMFGFAAFFVGTLSNGTLISSSVVFDLLIKISSLMAIIYFALNIFGAETSRVAQVVLGFGIIIWSVCILGITYFNIYVPMNSPDKIHLHLALISLMLFFVSEFRSLLLKMNKNVYVFSLFLAVFFSGVETIPSLINYFVSGMVDYDYLYYDVVIFTLFLYSTVRLVSFAFFVDTRVKTEETSPVECSNETESES